MPTLAAYNTSYVNDCHESQFNPFMSESSSILAKAIMIYNSKHPDEKITLNYTGNEDAKLENDYNLLKSDDELGEYLKILRNKMSDANTSYLNKLIAKEIDFIALTEQIAHVGKDHHANYDSFLNNKLDLGADNNNYGILRRLEQMDNVEDIDNPKNDGTKQYACVYDTIVNCQGTMPDKPPGLSSVAEGISIIYKKSIFGENPILAVWKRKSSGSVQKLKSLNEVEFNKINDIDVHYYSDDSGLSICYTDGDVSKPLKFQTNRGTADGGRPIIMTAGVNSQTESLIILVAIHGPNIPNLFEFGADTKDAKIQLKNKFGDSVNALFNQVTESISKFIDNGIESAQNKDKLINIKKVEVYLGGDFNDSRGLILFSLIEHGLKLNFTLGNFKPSVPVRFSGYKDLDKPDNINSPDNPIKQTQGRYKSLYSCCANGDSLNEKTRLDGDKLNKQGNGVFDKKHLHDFSQFSENMKNLKFIEPDNYGYNGDYALYGTTDTNFEKEQYMVIDTDESLKVNNLVYSSDHLPVISSFESTPFSSSGGRRRRNSTRKHIMKNRSTKKTLLKKPRSSHRKRKVNTHKK
jgi:hypothetical protein